jgi:hypothetical protein
VDQRERLLEKSADFQPCASMHRREHAFVLMSGIHPGASGAEQG